MKNYTSAKQSITASAIALAFVVATLSGTACAQYPEQQTQYPAASVPQPAAQPAPIVAPPRPHPIRDLFAGTLSALVNSVVTAATGGIVQGVGGSINNWFARKSGQQYAAYPGMAAQPTYAPAYPTTPGQDPYAAAQQQGYPSAQPQAYPPATQTYPAYPTNPSYPATTSDPYATSPSNPYGTTPAYPATDPAYGSYTPQVYDPQTGQYVSATGTPYATTSGYDGTLYAGVAYEVHAVDANGTTTLINPATHAFRTGDRFVVYYRPSMPGRMEVFNVNPLGQQTRIDSVNMAGGQLATLGPYQFASTTGDESLRIVLYPCSTPELLTATRDIVNVSGTAPATGGVQLGSCSTTTRDIRTRDITKVALDGGTSFALDPVSQQELNAGRLDARELTIVFHHR